MKHNYEFKINPPKLSDESIEQFKDFEKLLADYEKTAAPLGAKRPVRKMWWSVAASAAVLAGVCIYFLGNFGQPDFEQKQKEYFASQEFVNPPIKGLEDEISATNINAEKGGDFSSKSGSKYKIEPNALTTKSGEPVKGDVTIKYREMHDYVDFFVSGIPMTYDSAGVTYQLESAGMVEIYAEQNGEKLEINPDKPIQVELISEIPLQANQEVPKFNIYQLDMDNRNWKYQDVDNIQIVERDLPANKSKDALVASLNREKIAEIKRLENSIPLPLKPTKPNRANGSDFVFNFDFQGDKILSSETVSAEESAQLFEKYSMWQVKPGTGVSSNQLKQAWDDAQVMPLSNTDFELTLMKGDSRLKVIVNPVMTGEEYQKALGNYNGLLADYNDKLGTRNNTLDAQIAAVTEKYNSLKAKELDALNNGDDDGFYPAKVVNRFAVTDFGVWNCDRPYLPNDDEIQSAFIDDKNNKYDNHTAFLVDKTKNTIVKYYATDGTKVNFNNKTENLLWIVTNDEKLAVFRPEDFAKLEDDAIDLTFVMNVDERRPTSEAELREILYF